MAYKAYECVCADRAAVWAAIQLHIVEVGWTLHDDISATVKVYSSNGESGKEPTGYIWIDAGTSTYIEYAAYQHWDAVSHVGTRRRWAYNTQSNSRLIYFGSQYTLCVFAGDKDLIFHTVYANNISTHSAQMAIVFGHLPIRFDNALTNAEGTAGTAGTVTVASTAGLGVGKSVQIVGGTSGCDATYITELVNATTIKVAALAHNYGTGAVLGSPASTFGIVGVQGYQQWWQTSFYGDAGTAMGASYVTIANLSNPNVYSYLYNFQKKYVLAPILVESDSAASPGIMLGAWGQNIQYMTSFAGQILAQNNDSSFPDYGDIKYCTADTLVWKSNTWTVNKHAGRFVVILSGSAFSDAGPLWSVRKIVSNTVDTLTLQSDWTYQPGGGGIFMICDIVYRCIAPAAPGGNPAVKLTDTIVPS